VDSWLRSVSDTGGAWSPAAGLVGLAWAGTAAAATWCTLLAVSGTDPAGLLLAAVATLALGLAALYGTRVRPRLGADARGLTVGGLTGPRHHPWARVRDVRVRTVRRLGRDSTLLEIDVADPDGTEHLVIFGRLDLDADPVDVAAAITSTRG
jgi:Bacterial PH domain